jgi:hypothetical protein
MKGDTEDEGGGYRIIMGRIQKMKEEDTGDEGG